jgi:hypothetical protein
LGIEPDSAEKLSRIVFETFRSCSGRQKERRHASTTFCGSREGIVERVAAVTHQVRNGILPCVPDSK